MAELATHLSSSSSVRDPSPARGTHGQREQPAPRRATISSPIASDAVAPGLGAFRTCTALAWSTKWKSCTSSPCGVMAWARNAGAARIEIRCADLRDQALQRLGEQALAERAFDFLPTHASVTRQKVPQARIGNSVEEIARIDIPLAVTFAREGEHSVRTCFNTAVDQAGEVHAEEGELRIGHGVDQVAHERLAVRLDLVILAAEWNDADFAAQTGQFAHTITMKAGAVDKELGFEVSRLGFGAPAAGGLSQRTYFGVGCDAAVDAFHQGFADFSVIDNSFLRNP